MHATIGQDVLTDESDPYAEDDSHSLAWGSFDTALRGMNLVCIDSFESKCLVGVVGNDLGSTGRFSGPK